jgi:cytochrome c6
MKNIYIKLFFLYFSFSSPLVLAKEFDLNQGKKLFIANCNVCHISGKNLIIPEKNLKKETLEMNGMNNFNAIVYQIINGKNGMPAFGGRLQETEIEEIAFYVLQEANQSF